MTKCDVSHGGWGYQRNVTITFLVVIMDVTLPKLKYDYLENDKNQANNGEDNSFFKI